MLGLGLALALFDAHAEEQTGPAATDDNSLGDPFPIRRVLLPKDRLAAELERARQGTLVRLSRKTSNSACAKPLRTFQSEAPRLVDVHYRAKLLKDGLEENSLTGSAEWKIVHQGPGPALLPLDSLQIAIKQARWTDGRTAIVGFLDPRPQSGLALLVEEPGQHSLLVDWSARGLPEPGELRFDLAVPVSPIASFRARTSQSSQTGLFPRRSSAVLASRKLTTSAKAGGSPSGAFRTWSFRSAPLAKMTILPP